MRRILALLALAAGTSAAAYPPHAPHREMMMTMKKLSPVLVVDHVDSCAAFWTALGFARTVEVPHGGETGFVILQKDNVEIMYQSRASVADDIPALAEEPHSTVLYVETDDLGAVERAVGSAPVVVPRRTTFYGMTEVGVREPGGNLVIFAQPSTS